FSRKASSLLRDERGSVFIELALTLPIMMTLIFGGVELTRFMLNAQKVSRVAMSTADIISQAREITEADIMNVFLASNAIMGDESLVQNGNVILSSVIRPGTEDPIVNWQRRASLTHDGDSKVGSEGNAAQLPPNIELEPGDGVIVAEVYFNHMPFLFDTIVGEQDVYEVAYYRPRFGALEQILPNS
ncbi:MAG: TadE/TadG family type IV pilus assembly protein, partial [Pseudomonadota bacterium]